MTGSLKNPTLPPHVYCELSLENQVNIKEAVQFTLAFHPERSLLDSSGRLTGIAHAVNELVYPTCDDEDLVDMLCATTDAVVAWEETVQDERNRRLVGKALRFLAAQEPLYLEANLGAWGKHFAPFVRSVRYMLGELSMKAVCDDSNVEHEALPKVVSNF